LVLKIPSQPCLAKVRFDSVYSAPSVEVPLLASLYPGACLLGAHFWFHLAQLAGITRMELSPSFIFLLFVDTWQVLGCLPVQ